MKSVDVEVSFAVPDPKWVQKGERCLSPPPFVEVLRVRAGFQSGTVNSETEGRREERWCRKQRHQPMLCTDCH